MASKLALLVSTTGCSAFLAGWLMSKHARLDNSDQSPSTSASVVPLVQAATPVPDVVPQQLPSAGAPATRTSQIMRFGFPGTDQLRSLDNYVLSYDRRNRTAHWVVEHLTKDAVSKSKNADVDRAKCEFREDPSVHAFFRSSNEDYKGSGYDRGHLAAAGNHRLSQRHCDQTFLLSNMAPQVGRGFNRDAWNKLEKYVRHWTKSYANVYVCTGPLYLPRKASDGKTYVRYQVIGLNNLAVPTHFFKVIVGETFKQEYDMEAYVMPNAVIAEPLNIRSFQVPVETIERAAGLLFFDRIPRENFRQINGRKMIR